MNLWSWPASVACCGRLGRSSERPCVLTRGSVSAPADPLWSCAEVLYRPGSLTSSICRIRDGSARCELRLNHSPDDVLLDTADRSLDLRLSAAGGRVLVRLDTGGAEARAGACVILAGEFCGWSLQNVPREFRQVGPRKFIIDRADVLEVSAVHVACCPGCPIRAEDAPPRRRALSRPERRPAVARPGDAIGRILASGHGRGRGRVESAAEGEAKLASFRGVAYTGAPMRPMGWWADVIIDLDGVQVPSGQRPALRQHDHEQIVGHTTRIAVDGDGIKVAGVFSGQQEHVDGVVVPARNGFPWQLSVGADPVRTEFLEAGETDEVNGRKVAGPLTISRETLIGEFSFVPLGADRDTSVDVAASRGRLKQLAY